MAVVHRLAQRVGDARAHPDHGRLLYAELHGDVVGGLEANAADVPRQAIGILRHDLHGVGTVGLVDAHRPRRADAMAAICLQLGAKRKWLARAHTATTRSGPLPLHLD